MSVRVGDRQHNPSAILETSRNLLAYTYQTCTSEKVFPKSQRWALASPTLQKAIKICDRARQYTTEGITTQEQEHYRRKLLNNLASIFTYIELAYAARRITESQFEHWTELAHLAYESIK